MSRAASAPDPFLFNRSKRPKPEDNVGPGSYSPTKNYTQRNAPRATFGNETRFNSNHSSFLAASAAADLMCRESPGPKYNIASAFPTHPRAPTCKWGTKSSYEEMVGRDLAHMPKDVDLGPAAYQPKYEKIHPQAPTIRFNKADRWTSFGNQYQLNNSPYTSGGPNELPKDEYVRPAAPKYSFALPRAAKTDPFQKSRPRTHFLTHSIAGGLAMSATLECGVGPADYSNDQYQPVKDKERGPKMKFGTAPRFPRHGLEFISAEHAKAAPGAASPGPKYAYPQGETMFRSKMSRGNTMAWIP